MSNNGNNKNGTLILFTTRRFRPCYNSPMKYEHITKATFIRRDNRFVATVEIDGRKTGVHVKNTGRCRELLVPGATVYLDDHQDKMGTRKYRYDLVAVEKGDLLINMDSQAPNKVVLEALASGKLIPDMSQSSSPGADAGGCDVIRPETVYGNSRFDFYIERGDLKAFMEVKGVTLEDDGVARFPDAPTIRGIKHIRELEHALTEGYGAYIIFVVQMKGVKYFEPNDETHPQFGEALRHAKATGVQILAYDCTVTGDTLELDRPVPVRL